MAFTNLLQAMYPIGSVYLSTTSTSPASIIGGSWTAVTGACLAAQGDNYGSAASYSGSDTQVPQHSHYATDNDDSWHYSKFKIQGSRCGKLSIYSGGSTNVIRYIYASNEGYEDLDNSNTTANDGLNIISGAATPYHFSLYVWYRTA